VAARVVPEGPYCYALVAHGQKFYVGKGRGVRMYQHLTDAMRGKPGPKNDYIRAVLSEGALVECVVLEEFNTDEEAVAEENRLLKSLKGLTNIAGPRKCSVNVGERARTERALKRLRAMAAKILPFHIWDRLGRGGRRTAQEQIFYGQVMGEIDRTEQFLVAKLESANG
jgi:hypothetical protein